MRKVVLSMMTTLDGHISGPNGEMASTFQFDKPEVWEDLDSVMWMHLGDVDTLLLGRVTYQQWEKAWPDAAENPSATKNDIAFSRFADEVQKVVFSRTLEEARWKNTKLVRGDIANEVRRLKQMPGKNLALVGGAGLAQTFVRLGLIDEFLITVHPVVLGQGKPLFKDLPGRQRLELVETKEFRAGAVRLHYRALPRSEAG